MAIFLPERLQTQRLVLRAPRASDAMHIFASYAQDPAVVRYLVWTPHQSVGATQDFIASCMTVWANGRGRPYILARSDDDSVPLGMLDARLSSDTVDMGYVLQRASWGAGLMAEALDAVSTAALALPDCQRIQATCDTANHASARTLEKCGFVQEARLERHAVLPNLGPEPRPALMYARHRF